VVVGGPFDVGGSGARTFGMDVRQRGSDADLPFDELMATFDEAYGSGCTGATEADEAFAPSA